MARHVYDRVKVPGDTDSKYVALVERTDTQVAATLYEREDDGYTEAVAKMAGFWVKPKELKPECRKAVAELGATDNPDVLKVYDARLVNPSHKGRGYGRKLYDSFIEGALQEHSTFFMVPMECGEVGTTTKDALRVWESLARRYPSVKTSCGPVIRVG
jgi:GNAT superfamily N-acetyltransferase